MVDVVGGSSASSSNAITSVSELSGAEPTEEMVHAVINAIDIAIHNLICDGGELDYEELGPVGFRIQGAKSLDALRELRKMYVQALTDPELMLEVFEARSQWDDPGQ